jgi:enoyl-CoA hydratase/carnithine racemase
MTMVEELTQDMSVREHAEGKMLSAKQDGIGVLTFNQPQKHNAMSVEMWVGLAEILDDFAADKSIRIVVMTGGGGRAFVSGADISQFEQRRASADAQREYDEQTALGRRRLHSFRKPTIAAIRGFCLGGGLALAMQADLRISDTTGQFGIPAVRLGLAYGFEGLHRLVSLVGPANARMLMYTGSRIRADEALRIGLVNQVVEPDQLRQTVLDLARQIASNAPLSVAAAKLGIDQVLLDPAERDLGGLAAATAACFDSEDYREGRAAFREKRQPNFVGR